MNAANPKAERISFAVAQSNPSTLGVGNSTLCGVSNHCYGHSAVVSSLQPPSSYDAILENEETTKVAQKRPPREMMAAAPTKAIKIEPSRTSSTSFSAASGSTASAASASSDKFGVFQAVSGDTPLGQCSDRKYSFSLRTPGRDYILSAENGEALKEWASIISGLSRGSPIHSGYLALRDQEKEWSTRFFILFRNKVLNYYRSHGEVASTGG